MNYAPPTQPTLLLNEAICRANIQRMAQKAHQHDLQFKPHMKTHQSAEIGEWLRDYGTEAITVSSVSMASYFARHGWHDITIAFPCNLRETESINALAGNVSLTLLVNSLSTARTLQRQLVHHVEVYIELDTGAGRTGLPPSDVTDITPLVDYLTDEDTNMLQWKGFYSHPGHSYDARTNKEIHAVHQSVLDQINSLQNELRSVYGDFEVCIGDTPCCSAGTDFRGIDAVSPGNFVFYDLMQARIGSCSVSDIATAVVCPVVDRYADRNQLAIYGGAIHFSKESLTENGSTHYGQAATTNGQAWSVPDPDTCLARLSQEHGIVQCSPQTFERFSIGDLISILPVHSCLTAHLLGRFQLVSNGKRIEQFG
ncbi:D-serine deaminase, pyridoxal phosphate-dependent [Fodinibius roseus]|uniref:D-serine deaminase, pyridoxal phosphate-dependent n=1 Tax=Fodinibius roseus TaxID=1194090 RepID=A0A1M5F6A0_9BACT|nr:alanine racemase [Fodinibius roseus]SHF86908.1 D-serine deaminase, pyridoxal phosphate-dependent [Fodinibius roseus]